MPFRDGFVDANRHRLHVAPREPAGSLLQTEVFLPSVVGWHVYPWSVTEHQFCWAHLISTLRVYMRSVQRRVEALSAAGAAAPHFKSARTCATLLKRPD